MPSEIPRPDSLRLFRSAGKLVLPASLLVTQSVIAAEGSQGTEKKPPAVEETAAEKLPGADAQGKAAEGDAPPQPSEPGADTDEATETEADPEEKPEDEDSEGQESAGEEPENSKGSEEGDPANDESTVADKDDESWMDLKQASEDLESQDDTPKKMPQFRIMVLVEASIMYGGFTFAEPGQSLSDDDPDVENLRAGNAAGRISLGVMPGGRAFMMGGRLRGGSYLGDRITRGNVAAETFFGANFARNGRGTEFTHISGGFGVEFLPGENRDLLTVNLSGGTVINGLAFGAGFYGGANDEVALGMFGLNMGWGQLF